ncbi:DUF2182 domain-containing protein [uncultured Nitratireductor sp.]|uniref:DUF2182 domain-containing protein n=1 Tax=uncultured Nitratireductor sp. TaxID=520953 RepID=UPI0025CEF286|nr:DUF2182 domain-containing protein [uncultured Nitratireductor sp.]
MIHEEPHPKTLAGTGRTVHRLSLMAFPISLSALILAVVTSWILLALMGGGIATIEPRAAGPGGVWLGSLPEMPLPASLETLLSLCLTPVQVGGGARVFAVFSFMWFLMAFAMMLPSATPLIRTYCEIADTAARKDHNVVHPLVLVAGYLTVWLAASICFATIALGVEALYDRGSILSPWTGHAGAIVLLIAGLYQFSGLKEACLVKCRNPFATLFGRWSTRPAAIYRLGLRQGLWCLGCCWALMLVMFAVGLMNLFWMALLGVFTMVEKSGHSRIFTRVSGGLLLVWALALLVVSV